MKVVCFFLFSYLSFNVFAQDYKFGKISKEELQEKFNPLDSSANATYLYKYRKTYFVYSQQKGFELVTDIHERIKIYNQEGFNYATKQLNLYKNARDEVKMASLKGYTYNLIDGKAEETKIGKEGVFKTEQSKYWNEIKFTMPNIKVGSVIEYKYKIISSFVGNVDDFVFQHDIPVKKLEAKLETPEYFGFKVKRKGYLNVIANKEQKRDKITFYQKYRPSQTATNATQGGSTRYSSNEIEYSTYLTNYSLSNIPALKQEPYVNNINNYRSSVKYELSYIKYPQTPIEYFSTSWEKVVKTIYKNPSFGDQLDKTSYYEDDIKALVSKVSNPMEKVALIYQFVKNNVKWNGYIGKFSDEGVRKAYLSHVGNVAEINLMLTSMLRYAGLKAYPVLVSTRQNGIPLFPTLDGYNYVVTYVKLERGTILLDATNKYCLPNVLPYKTLNWQGRIISENGGSQLIDLYPKDKSENNISMMISLLDDGNIKGFYRSVKTNHTAFLFRELYNDSDKESFLNKLENKYNGIEISNYDVKNSLELSKPIVESYKFVKESQLDIIGNKMYFSPLFFFKFNENPFKLEKREFPIDFGYPTITSFKVIVNLPEGYKVESLPEPGLYKLPDNLGLFKYNLSAVGNKVQLVVCRQINHSVISHLYYDTLKVYFSKLVEKESEQIVLTKVE
ncbi:DUF3857 domain-containing protein [Thalassobellus sediminis]|uniref:DUF3857 domain-containing protein n=1 Tax=Thalassobellus sediminis TaxID=3367753 RepID=UPI003795E035